VSERRQAAAAGDPEAETGPIFVWNGLVTRMRRAGAERSANAPLEQRDDPCHEMVLELDRTASAPPEMGPPALSTSTAPTGGG
jgi:hypothetical protein